MNTLTSAKLLEALKTEAGSPNLIPLSKEDSLKGLITPVTGAVLMKELDNFFSVEDPIMPATTLLNNSVFIKRLLSCALAHGLVADEIEPAAFKKITQFLMYAIYFESGHGFGCLQRIIGTTTKRAPLSSFIDHLISDGINESEANLYHAYEQLILKHVDLDLKPVENEIFLYGNFANTMFGVKSVCDRLGYSTLECIRRFQVTDTLYGEPNDFSPSYASEMDFRRFLDMLHSDYENGKNKEHCHHLLAEASPEDVNNLLEVMDNYNRETIRVALEYTAKSNPRLKEAIEMTEDSHLFAFNPQNWNELMQVVVAISELYPEILKTFLEGDSESSLNNAIKMIPNINSMMEADPNFPEEMKEFLVKTIDSATPIIELLGLDMTPRNIVSDYSDDTDGEYQSASIQQEPSKVLH